MASAAYNGRLPQENEVVVCCYCGFGRPRVNRLDQRKESPTVQSFEHYSRDVGVQAGGQEAPPPSPPSSEAIDLEYENTNCSTPKTTNILKKELSTIVEDTQAIPPVLLTQSESSKYYDALENLEDEEPYPIVFTNSIPEKPQVSFDEPESMLYMSHHLDEDTETEIEEDLDKSSPMNHSARFDGILRRGTLEHKQALESPRVRVALRGYPGELTVEELHECQIFIRHLRGRHSHFEDHPNIMSEMVHSLRDIEEEPYAICRFLRATKFSAEKIIERLDGMEFQRSYIRAKESNFYPDVGQAIGCPFSVFLTQYPFLPVGRGRNGCPVNYFQAGRINPEGMLCLTTVDRVERYFWHNFKHKFRNEITKVQREDPNVVKMEGINILDLQGLSSAALSSETMEVVKLASKVSDYFPETLHCMLILNAPSFFSLSWGLIKKFIDPRTAKRIQVFSSESKGLKRLQELVDPSQIPSDYGGQNTSIEKVLLGEAQKAGGKNMKRQEIELMYVKKRGQTKISLVAQRGETFEIRAYTRSISSAKFSLYTEDKTIIVSDVQARSLVEEDSESDTGFSVRPNCTLIVSDVTFSGTFTLKCEDMDDANRKLSGSSRGYFLVVSNFR